MTINYQPIGVINSTHKTKEGMPIQAKAAKGLKGTIIIKEEFMEGLKDLEAFSHLYLIYHFHKSNQYNLTAKPFLDDKTHGVFATRVPQRPNQIGISVVKLISIKNNILKIENLDILDNTPLLDIKPYIPDFDIHEVNKIGWYENKIGNFKSLKSDNRFN